MLFLKYNNKDYALLQKKKQVNFKLKNPNQQNQVTKEVKQAFEKSNKFFKICEITNEFELIKLDDINDKLLVFDFYYMEKNVLCITEYVGDHN